MTTCPTCHLTIPAQTCKHCAKPRDQWEQNRRTKQDAEYCSFKCVRARNDKNHRIKVKEAK